MIAPPVDDAAALGAWLAACTLDLCRIPSVTGDEDAIAAELARRAAAQGGEARVRRLGNAVLAEGPRRPGRKVVALLGHSDTVRPAAEQPLGIDGDAVYGCGATDMKGGLAVMLALLAEAARPGDGDAFTADLRCVFYDREEGPADESGLLPLCAAGLFSREDVDLALCLEPTDNRIEAGCVGGLHGTLLFRGRRAHSARPWLGDNAIYQALPLLQRLADRPRRPVTLDGLTFYEVLSATQAHTENSRNVIPDRFALNLNYRFAPGKTPAQAEAELRAWLGEEAAALQITDRAPAGAVCLSHPRLQRLRAELGLEVAAKQAWTDVARLTALGIAAVNLGPGETALAHQANERVRVSELIRCAQLLRRLLCLPTAPAHE